MNEGSSPDGSGGFAAVVLSLVVEAVIVVVVLVLVVVVSVVVDMVVVVIDAVVIVVDAVVVIDVAEVVVVTEIKLYREICITPKPLLLLPSTHPMPVDHSVPATHCPQLPPALQAAQLAVGTHCVQHLERHVAPSAQVSLGLQISPVGMSEDEAVTEVDVEAKDMKRSMVHMVLPVLPTMYIHDTNS